MITSKFIMKGLHGLLFVLVLAAAAPAQDSASAKKGMKTFDAVWKIVNEQHFDPNFNGVDWDAVKVEMRPRAERAEDMAGVRIVIGEMLARLEQSHFSLVEKEELGKGAKSEAASPVGTAGFDVRFRNEVALVSYVEKGGPADLAGVKLGWSLIAIDGDSLGKMVEGFSKSKTLPLATKQRRELLLRIDGPIASKVQLSFLTSAGRFAEKKEIELSRVVRDAVPFDMPGLPTFYLTLHAQKIQRGEQTVGVVHFSNWFTGISKQIDEELFAMRDCDGIVLDLRGNSGGNGMMAGQVAGHFFEEQASLGTQRGRNGDWEYRIRPRRSYKGDAKGIFTGPLVILTDETTGSCSEIFTGGLQALGRARVIGEVTAGAALPATLSRLPNGDFLLHAIGDFVTALGQSMEGDGVQPDEVVALTRENLLAETDASLEAAVKWIGSQASLSRAP